MKIIEEKNSRNLLNSRNKLNKVKRSLGIKLLSINLWLQP